MYWNLQSDWLIWCLLESVSGCPKKVLCFSFLAWILGKSRVFCVLYLSKSASYKTSLFTRRGKGGRWPILQNTRGDPGFTTIIVDVEKKQRALQIPISNKQDKAMMNRWDNDSRLDIISLILKHVIIEPIMVRYQLHPWFISHIFAWIFYGILIEGYRW